MFHNFAYGMGWGMFPMMIWWLLLIVGIIWLIVSQVGRRQQDSPLSTGEVLEQRYARGDLLRDEYLTMKADLDK